MFYKARCCQTVLDKDTMNYIKFGKGSKPLVILPGLGDGLAPVHGWLQAAVLAVNYRKFAEKFQVYIFSRRNSLKGNYSTRDMAEDQAEAMKTLGISKAYVMGVSQGGLIAQYLAVDHPDLVDKLVLAVTLPGPNENMRKKVNGWKKMAEEGQYKSLMIDTAENSYSEGYLKKYRIFYPILGRIGKPKDFERFLIQADSCLSHDARSELDKIKCPTLIIGGSCDRIAGADASVELHKKIKGSELIMYQGLGHAAYEEAEDFNNSVIRYLLKEKSS